MIETRFVLVALLSLVLSPSSLRGDSILYQVTPENIDEQRLTLRVETEERASGTIWFRIFVAPGSSDISPHRDGRFEVLEGDERIIACNVEEQTTDSGLQYSFGVHRRFLSSARFTFRNYEPNGMPSLDGYRFELIKFVN